MVRRGIFHSFFHHNFQPEVDNDIISGVAVDYVDVDVHEKFVDSAGSNDSRDIQGAVFVSNERT